MNDTKSKAKRVERWYGACGFWERVDQSGGPDACWEWQGFRGTGGYGTCWRNTEHGLFQKAHRFAWYLTNGPIPDGLVVCHKCDNRPCCNPSHLFLGTPADNNADMCAKGRRADLSGERHGRARLSNADVTEIRRLRFAGMPRQEVADRFGVRIGTVSKITHGHWRSSDGEWPDKPANWAPYKHSDMRFKPKRCAECGSAFIPGSSNGTYCGPSCRRIARNRRERQHYAGR